MGSTGKVFSLDRHYMCTQVLLFWDLQSSGQFLDVGQFYYWHHRYLYLKWVQHLETESWEKPIVLNVTTQLKTMISIANPECLKSFGLFRVGSKKRERKYLGKIRKELYSCELLLRFSLPLGVHFIP